jgi:hypothetical protein
VLLTAAATTKKEEAYLWKAGASRGHITNLKQSILETFDIYCYSIVSLAQKRVHGRKLLRRDVELRPRTYLQNKEDANEIKNKSCFFSVLD